eukprot:2523331-Rhodomonas_salina.1
MERVAEPPPALAFTTCSAHTRCQSRPRSGWHGSHQTWDLARASQLAGLRGVTSSPPNMMRWVTASR